MVSEAVLLHDGFCTHANIYLSEEFYMVSADLQLGDAVLYFQCYLVQVSSSEIGHLKTTKLIFIQVFLQPLIALSVNAGTCRELISLFVFYYKPSSNLSH